MKSKRKESFFSAWFRSFFMGSSHAFSFNSWHTLPEKFTKASTKQNFLYSIKVTIACILAYTTAELLHLEYSLWAPLATLMVMQIHMSSSLELSLLRLFGTLFGAAIGLACSVLMPATLEGRIIGIAIVVPICAFLELWEERFRSAGVTAVFVLLLGHTQDSGIVLFALNRVFEMFIGSISALLVSALLWPASAAAEVRKTTHEQFALTAELIQKLTHDILFQERKVSQRAMFRLLNKISNNTQQFYRVRNYELAHIYREYPLLPNSVRLLDELRMYISTMMDALETEDGVEVTEEIGKIIEEVSEALTVTLYWMADPSQPPSRPLRPLVEDRAIRFATVREEGLFRKYEAEKIVALFSFYHGLHNAAQAVALFQERLMAAQEEKVLPPSKGCL